MRLVIARCEVEYTGRLSAHLPMATRLVMVKADGCVAVHSDEGAYKPLNWMSAPNHLEEREGEWLVTNPAGERLLIRFEEVLSDSEHALGVAPGLTKDGVEAEMQRLLAEAPFVLEEGLSLLRREYPTDLEDTACPGCGSADFSVVRGRELLVRSVAGEASSGPAGRSL